ncbi:MAG: hypothetical protein CMO81_05305 [Waddliaceae bacterium]|nr:hypothetical protein [Waddliaceae bacterium]
MIYKKLFLFFIVLLFSACQSAKHPNYAQRAYLQQKAEHKERLNDRGSWNETTSEQLTVDLTQDEHPEWLRQPYETIDEWHQRIQDLMEHKQEKIETLEAKLNGLNTENEALIQSIQGMVQRNADLKSMIHRNTPSEKKPALNKVEAMSPPSFRIHIVEKGETLFSLSMRYYGTASKQRDIMIWNRGWVRHPDDILAGVALILFDEFAKEKKQQVVDAYINKLRTVI